MNYIKPMIFVFGIGHSGTTLTASIIGTAPKVLLLTEETRLLLNPDKYEKARNHFTQLLQNSVNKERICEKTPMHLARCREIKSYFETDAQLVCTIRNPLDIYSSLLARMNNTEYSRKRVLEGLKDTIIARDIGCHIVKYESLISNPKISALELCNYLDLPYSDSLLEFHKQKFSWFGFKEPEKPANVDNGKNHNMNRSYQLRQPLFDGRNRWIKDLSDSEITECIEIFQPFSIQLGYDLTNSIAIKSNMSN